MAGITITYDPSCDPVTVTLEFPFYIKVNNDVYFKATADRIVEITPTKTEVFFVATTENDILDRYPNVDLGNSQITEGVFKYYLNRNNTYFNG